MSGIAERIVKKALAAKEDLLLGTGVVYQVRNGTTVGVNKINSSHIPYSGDEDTGNFVSIKDKLDDISLEINSNEETFNSISTNRALAPEWVQPDGTQQNPAYDLHFQVKSSSGILYESLTDENSGILTDIRVWKRIDLLTTSSIIRAYISGTDSDADGLYAEVTYEDIDFGTDFTSGIVNTSSNIKIYKKGSWYLWQDTTEGWRITNLTNATLWFASSGTEILNSNPSLVTVWDKWSGSVATGAIEVTNTPLNIYIQSNSFIPLSRLPEFATTDSVTDLELELDNLIIIKAYGTSILGSDLSIGTRSGAGLTSTYLNPTLTDETYIGEAIISVGDNVPSDASAYTWSLVRNVLSNIQEFSEGAGTWNWENAGRPTQVYVSLRGAAGGGAREGGFGGIGASALRVLVSVSGNVPINVGSKGNSPIENINDETTIAATAGGASNFGTLLIAGGGGAAPTSSDGILSGSEASTDEGTVTPSLAIILAKYGAIDSYVVVETI